MPPPRMAIVTGASSGIGRAIAVAFGGLGWRVAIGARRTERLDEAAAEVRAAGGAPFAHLLDVADTESIAAFCAAAEAELGPVDVLVNNAGVASPGWLDRIPVEAIQHEVATNLLGPILMTRHAVSSLRARDAAGDIVFITSDATRHPRPRMATYTATKGGVEALAHALALELEGSGIRASIVRVGPTLSDFGFGWPMDELVDLMAYWPRFGLQRHAGVLEASTVARAVIATVTAPAGVHVELTEVQPEAPVGDSGPAEIVERPAAP